MDASPTPPTPKRALEEEDAIAAPPRPPKKARVARVGMVGMEKRECQICFESRAEGFACPTAACGIWTCYACFRKSLNDYGIMCMSCNTPLPEERWYDLFPSSFVNTHIHGKASVELFNRFQAQLPAIQPSAEHEKRAREIRAETDRLLDAHVKLQTEMRELKRQADAINAKRDELLRNVRVCEHERDAALGVEAQKRGAVVVRIIKCFTPSCPAFLDAAMNCNICEHTYCAKCQELAHPDTPCDANRVANVSYIRRNTTPCPKCATPIQQIDGCDQMFCVVPGCNTFFSNQTGRAITTGARHNPHYFEALRRGVQIPLEVDAGPAAAPCVEGLPHERALMTLFNARTAEEASIMRFHRGITHVLVHLPEPGMLDRADVRVNGMSSINFLLGSKNRGRSDCRQKLDPYLKPDFVRDLKKVWKQHNRKEAEQTILRTACAVAGDLLRHAVNARQTVKEVYASVCYFVAITNAELTRVAESFGNVPSGLFIADAGSKHHLDYFEHRLYALRVADRHPVPTPAPAPV